MRVSANKGDPGFERFDALRRSGKVVKVFLDGVEQKMCTVADEEAGLLTRFVPDADGGPQIDPGDPGRILSEECRGAVRVEIADQVD